ncbi:MAG TPA: non-canonical purine NTP pyrophosphatase [Patescibacteria group bacterium]|nr:non-canonical purine NTP pyrophosphatase [Patescibacteria group bacterium]
MKNVIFITGNQGKADQLAKWLGLPIEHRKLDLDEIQSLDLREVVEHKVRQAYALAQQPVLVEDVSVTFTAMGRLPGTLIKWFLEELGNDGLCRLAGRLEHPGAVASICYAYFDGQEVRFFEHHVPGTIAPEPRGDAFGWNPSFIPDGATKTYAEMSDTEVRPFSMRAQAIDKMKVFLQDV